MHCYLSGRFKLTAYWIADSFVESKLSVVDVFERSRADIMCF